ncbi:unnamed protein product [Protopolystoma xenopodis]|uniref:Uncharacterized protein n=1 Tax=Protopolystoma xenopodis TaxID=117903 RepID=A0A3S5BW90_9PLAT|nr:unnamed protein product [Protopolystoma xenopodis]
MACALEENCFPPSVYSLISRQPQQAYASYRRLLRFTSIIHNRGTAPFRPHEPRENWVWHACHRLGEESGCSSFLPFYPIK